ASLEASVYGGFLRGMRELGYVEGRDFVIEWRFAEGDYERFATFASEFAELKVDVILSSTSGGLPIVVREVTTSIPIVLAYSVDPVAQGLVESLSHPGGNITGLSTSIGDILPKQLALLKMTVPKVSRVAALLNPTNATAGTVLKAAEREARLMGLVIRPVETRNRQEIDKHFVVLHSS